jgi:glycosyltransferase involved in cell wall biosynthesis
MPFDGGHDSSRTRPLRIALFSGNYNYTLDGANKTLNRLVDHLERVEGCRVRVYSPTSPTPAFEPKGELVSVPSIPIPTRTDYRMAVGLPPAIRRNVEAFRPDIVHLSAPDLLGMGAQKLARRLGAPVVASLHTLFESYLDYYALGWLKPALERRLHTFYDACDYVLTPTRAVGDDLRAAGVRAGMRVWARGVDGDLFQPDRRDLDWRRAQGFRDDQTVAVFLGRLVMEKGLAVFAEAADRARALDPSLGVLVIGDGPARGWMQDRLPRAAFTGFQSGEALARALASGDLLLNPSKTESFGNVTLEAMASGLPVVAADAVSPRAILRHGETGFLCPADDPRAYAAALARLAAEPALRRAMGAAARDASAAYRWNEILAGVAGVYREALAPRAEERVAA